jgi:CHAD domain-containing protein
MRAELKKIRRAGRAITAKSPDEALHRLRVRCKRLRYACETLGDVYGKPVAKMARRLAALQDVLGAHQDAVAALALIDIVRTEAAAAEPAEAAVAAALGRCDGDWRRERLARRAAFPKAWRAFDREKPRHAFLKALRRHCS